MSTLGSNLDPKEAEGPWIDPLGLDKDEPLKDFKIAYLWFFEEEIIACFLIAFLQSFFMIAEDYCN